MVMLPYLTLMRPLNSLMSAIAVFVGGFVALGLDLSYFFGFAPLYLAMVIVFLITGAGNAINDVIDVDSDKINRPGRPIPSGKVSKRKALGFSIFLFAAGIVLSGFLNWICFFIAIFNSVLLVLYSSVLQDKLFLGNISVSYLVGSTFLFGGAAVLDLKLPLLLMLLASLANLSREIVKDLEDIEGDRLGLLKKLASDIKTSVASRFGMDSSGKLKIKYGKQAMVNAAIASLTCAILVSPMPFILGILGWLYLVLVVPVDIIFLLCIFFMAKAKGKKQFSRISKLIKIGMFLGLIAFVAGVLL